MVNDFLFYFEMTVFLKIAENKRWCACWIYMYTQQKQNMCITFVQCGPNVFDIDQRLYKCYANILCLLDSVGPTKNFM